MTSLFEQIRLDIIKHKNMGLTQEEIDALPPLEIEIDEEEFIGWLFNGDKSSNQTNGLTEIETQTQLFMDKAQDLGLVGKSAESYVKGQLIIWERNKRQEAEEDAKLLGTAMQQLLPDIFEDKRAIPNCFLRGALFGMVRKGRRAVVKDEPIFTMSQYKVSFSGEHLNQNDLEVWDTLMYLAKERKVDSELRITLYSLCQSMKIPDNGINRKTLVNRVKRLAFGLVSIKTNGKEYFGSLIDDGYIDNDGDGKLVIKYNKKLAPLFTDGDYTLISADIRHLLGDNQLARWLYNFYESHMEPIPFGIDFIQKLCRSENSLKDFKYKIKIALQEVKKAHLSVNHKSKWDYEITDKNYLLVYPKGKSKNS